MESNDNSHSSTLGYKRNKSNQYSLHFLLLRQANQRRETAKVVAESAPEASPELSSSLAATGPLSSLSSSPPAPASPSLPALAPSPSSMSPSPPSAAEAARAPAVQPVTIPRTNPVEDVHARHVEVHERIVGQIFLLDQGV